MAHIHEKIDFCAGAYIVYEDKVLLRKHDKYHIWLHPGGHVELDEDPVECAIREAKEEVGLDIQIIPTQQTTKIGETDNLINSNEKNLDSRNFKNLITPAYMNRHKITQTHTHIDLIYFAKSQTDKVEETIEREKSGGWKWFTKEELDSTDENISEIVKFYAKKAIEVVNNSK